jgi:Rod binding domain-containing protein
MQIGSPLTSVDIGAAAESSLRAKAEGTAATSELAREFESVFVSMMLKQMRSSLSEEGLFPGDSGDTFGGLFDMHMSQHITEAGGIGLSEAIGRYLAANQTGA